MRGTCHVFIDKESLNKYHFYEFNLFKLKMNDLTHKFDIRAKHPRVAQDIRQRIARGAYARGAQLPHRDLLEADLGASRATVQAALNTLQNEGFLRGVTGRGTYVSEQLPFDTNYGLFFPLMPEHFARHRFYSSMLTAARTAERATACHIHPYYAVADRATPDALRATADCLEHRLGGAIFSFPPTMLEGSPIFENGPPRVAVMQDDSGYQGPKIYPDWDTFFQLAMVRLASQSRRRVAVITCDARPDLPAQLSKLAHQVGITCLEPHVQVVHPAWLYLARRVVSLLFSGPRDERPDALIIADDNLVDHASAALLSLGLGSDEISVIAHACVPLAPTSHVPCEMLVFDVTEMMNNCVTLLRAQRQGTPVPSMTRLLPKFMSPLEISRHESALPIAAR